MDTVCLDNLKQTRMHATHHSGNEVTLECESLEGGHFANMQVEPNLPKSSESRLDPWNEPLAIHHMVQTLARHQVGTPMTALGTSGACQQRKDRSRWSHSWRPVEEVSPEG